MYNFFYYISCLGSLSYAKKSRALDETASHRAIVRSVTCRMGSHSVTFHPTQVIEPPTSIHVVMTFS